MAEAGQSMASVAMGDGGTFQLTLAGPSGEQRFDLDTAAISDLVQALTAVAWASAAGNRPPAGTSLPAISAFPVKSCNVGTMQGQLDPVLMVELFGGVRLGMHLTFDNARSVGETLVQMTAAKPYR
jgi:hypothetical protein